MNDSGKKNVKVGDQHIKIDKEKNRADITSDTKKMRIDEVKSLGNVSVQKNTEQESAE